MFLGSLVNLIVPLQDNLDIDYPALQKLVHLHVMASTEGIVLTNEVSELSYLTRKQREEVIQTIAVELGSRIPLVVETTGKNVRETMKLCVEAQYSGADGCFISLSQLSKNKGKLQKDLLAIANTIAIPMLLKDETGEIFTPEEIAQFAQVGNVVGIIETSSDLIRATKIQKLLRKNVSVYASHDASTMEYLFYGASGAISIVANVAPKIMFDLCEFSLNKERNAAEKKNLRLFSLYEPLDTKRPSAVKCALAMMGIIQSEANFYGEKLSDLEKNRLKHALKLAGTL